MSWQTRDEKKRKIKYCRLCQQSTSAVTTYVILKTSSCSIVGRQLCARARARDHTQQNLPLTQKNILLSHNMNSLQRPCSSNTESAPPPLTIIVKRSKINAIDCRCWNTNFYAETIIEIDCLCCIVPSSFSIRHPIGTRSFNLELMHA